MTYRGIDTALSWDELADKFYDARAENERLRALLEQIAVCCTDNMGPRCNHRMALDFVRRIANSADEQTPR